MPEQHSLKEKWSQHLQSWRDSGLSQSVWCRLHDIKPNQYWYWRKKLDEASLPADSITHKGGKPSPFVPVIPDSQAVATTPVSSPLAVSLPNGLTVSGLDQTNLRLAQKLTGLLL